MIASQIKHKKGDFSHFPLKSQECDATVCFDNSSNSDKTNYKSMAFKTQAMHVKTK